jgi:hypothetical protein
LVLISANLRNHWIFSRISRLERAKPDSTATFNGLVSKMFR